MYIHVLGSVLHGRCLVWVQRAVMATAACCSELITLNYICREVFTMEVVVRTAYHNLSVFMRRVAVPEGTLAQ